MFDSWETVERFAGFMETAFVGLFLYAFFILERSAS